MDIHNEFIAQEKDLVFYSGKAILNKRHAFFDINNEPWDFSFATGYTFKIWEEREGGRQMIDCPILYQGYFAKYPPRYVSTDS